MAESKNEDKLPLVAQRELLKKELDENRNLQQLECLRQSASCCEACFAKLTVAYPSTVAMFSPAGWFISSEPTLQQKRCNPHASGSDTVVKGDEDEIAGLKEAEEVLEKKISVLDKQLMANEETKGASEAAASSWFGAAAGALGGVLGGAAASVAAVAGGAKKAVTAKPKKTAEEEKAWLVEKKGRREKQLKENKMLQRECADLESRKSEAEPDDPKAKSAELDDLKKRKVELEEKLKKVDTKLAAVNKRLSDEKRERLKKKTEEKKDSEKKEREEQQEKEKRAENVKQKMAAALGEFATQLAANHALTGHDELRERAEEAAKAAGLASMAVWALKLAELRKAESELKEKIAEIEKKLKAVKAKKMEEGFEVVDLEEVIKQAEKDKNNEAKVMKRKVEAAAEALKQHPSSFFSYLATKWREAEPKGAGKLKDQLSNASTSVIKFGTSKVPSPSPKEAHRIYNFFLSEVEAVHSLLIEAADEGQNAHDSAKTQRDVVRCQEIVSGLKSIREYEFLTERTAQRVLDDALVPPD
jgi:myosin heavy subunit